jgi:hypothetical protein
VAAGINVEMSKIGAKSGMRAVTHLFILILEHLEPSYPYPELQYT